MDPTTAAAVIVVFLSAIVRSVAALVLGIAGAVIAGIVYVLFLRHSTIEGFFASASEVSVGILIALIARGLNSSRRGVIAGETSQFAVATVALAAVGLISSLSGELVTGSGVRGVLFALSWGGMTARPGIELDRRGRAGIRRCRERSRGDLPKGDRPVSPGPKAPAADIVRA